MAKVATWLPPVLLILVSIHHFHHTHVSGLTPWKGGGFGMFSTIDDQDYRRVRIWVHVDGATYPGDVGSAFTRDLARARFLPREKAVEKLGRKLVDAIWVTNATPQGVVARCHPTFKEVTAEAGTFRPEKVTIDTYTIGLDRRRRELQARRIARVETVRESRGEQVDL